MSFDHVSLLGNSLEKNCRQESWDYKDGQLCIYAQNLAELENAVKKETDNSVNVLKKYENLQVELDTQNYKTIVKILESEKLEEFENIEDKKINIIWKKHLYCHFLENFRQIIF